MRIVMAQLNYTLGDLAGNGDKILDVIKKHAASADLIVFSELCLSGYYPHDYLSRPGFIEAQDAQLARIMVATRGQRATVIVGYAERNPFSGKPLYNALGVIGNGTMQHSYHKRLLCDYNIYNEPRHFAAGDNRQACLINGRRVGFLICEDAWNGQESGGAQPNYSHDPVVSLAAERPELIISINGSPSNAGKQAQRLAVVASVARRCQAPVIYVNQVGGNDAIVYDGNSLAVGPDGSVSYALPSFEEAVAELDVMAMGQLAMASTACLAPAAPMPEPELFYRQAITGIRDYTAKCGFSSVVIGLSGGVDSAVVAMLAAEALGPNQVTGVLMPSRHSSQGSLDDARALAASLGIRTFLAPIDAEYQLAMDQHEAAFGAAATGVTVENIQARLRGRKLMEYSNQYGALLLTTGNKSELGPGYGTLYGDMCGGLNPIGDLYKTDVYALAAHHNRQHPERPIPAAILTKEPSAELSDGQKDTDSLPPYEILDAILKLYIEGDMLGAAEQQQQIDTLAMTSSSVVGRVLRLVDRAEYKRQQSPTILRLRQLAFGNGRQYPISGHYFDEDLCRRLLHRPTGGAQ